MSDEQNIWHRRQAHYDRWFPVTVSCFIVTIGALITLLFIGTGSVQSQSSSLYSPLPNTPSTSFEPIATSSIINLKSASIDELDKLSGIGPKKAEQIVALREEGKINAVSDLQKVKGIGPKLYSEIKDQLVWE